MFKLMSKQARILYVTDGHREEPSAAGHCCTRSPWRTYANSCDLQAGFPKLTN